jgi:cytochrome c
MLYKKIVLVGMVAFAAACGNNSNTEKKETTTAATATTDLSSNPDYAKGLELIGKSDCLTCHKINEKGIGPSYKEIAVKYADKDKTFVDSLAGKIISGGNGVWGSVAMTPHPNLSKEDAVAMTKYILLLKDTE